MVKSAQIWMSVRQTNETSRGMEDLSCKVDFAHSAHATKHGTPGVPPSKALQHLPTTTHSHAGCLLELYWITKSTQPAGEMCPLRQLQQRGPCVAAVETWKLGTYKPCSDLSVRLELESWDGKLQGSFALTVPPHAPQRPRMLHKSQGHIQAYRNHM